MPPPVMRVATTDITEMMNPGPERRMDLPGFDPEFVDFPHYIIRITERIWHDREVELCLKWYSEDCAIHTLAGPITGAQTVVDNTWATLAAFPDRRLDGDNVIWSDEGDGSFLSSHLITSKMTNLGDSDFGPATGEKVLVRTIADCLCRDNRIVEEWLVRDNLALVEQLGFDAQEVAARQAARDAEKGRPLTEVLAPYHAEALAGADAAPQSEAQRIATDLLRARWQAGDAARAAALSDFRCNAWMPGGRFLYGPDQLAEWSAPIRAAFGPRARLRIEHIAEVPYLGEARDVAVRWSLAGWHEGDGRYGAPTGAPLLVMAVSHFRVIEGRAREEVTVWDDIAVLRQIVGAVR
ncbi:ester cyclase [Erythrobacter sp. NE805]|uniref:ester cyclase n=1 Tax=Erythrobacter sp. NE805 TaxID=3389875 RepID=UPI00396AF5B4